LRTPTIAFKYEAYKTILNFIDDYNFKQDFLYI
jgi:hypothetical protein